jgi:predicted RNA-binding protein with RPS1 domain
LIDQWNILRYIHKIGSPLKGTVIGFDEYGAVLLETRTGYQSRLSIDFIEESSLIPDRIPFIGQEINTVIQNFVDGVLYLSAKPSHTCIESIQEWQAYYDFIEMIEIGSEITGIVSSIKPFGIFVDIGAPYIGLIDMGHDSFSDGDRLPDDMSIFAKGEKITCRIGYLRLHNRQIGLGWIAPSSLEV